MKKQKRIFPITNVSKKHKILLVDDVVENLQIVERILEVEGYSYAVAKDGLTALRLVKEEDFDLILLDIQMPIMDGIETCRYLKVEPTTSHIPVIFLTASDDASILSKAYRVGAVDYIRKPFHKEELLARVKTHLKLHDYEIDLKAEVAKKTKEISDTQVQLMYTLGGIAEGHSKETHLHVRRVAEFTYRLAILAGLDDKEAQLLKNASSLHDVGKLGIADSILHKEEKLTNKEYKTIKKHATLGANMLKHSELPLFKTAKIVCEEHHEKWDGSGYPKRLKGNNIHIYGRIVAIADVFDALSFRRSYKAHWSISEVLEYMKEMSGTHFDPKLIEIFFKHIDDFLIIYDTNMQIVKKEEKTTSSLSEKKRKNIFTWLLNR